MAAGTGTGTGTGLMTDDAMIVETMILGHGATVIGTMVEGVMTIGRRGERGTAGIRWLIGSFLVIPFGIVSH